MMFAVNKSKYVVPKNDLTIHISSSLYPLISGSTPNTAANLLMYVAPDFVNYTATRNTGIWTGANVDITCIPFCRTEINGNGNQGAGVLVARDIVITAWHNSNGVTGSFRFVDNNNVQTTCSYITASVIVVGVTQLDIQVNRITPAPLNITPCKVFPDHGWGVNNEYNSGVPTYIPGNNKSGSVHCIMSNANRELHIGTLLTMDQGGFAVGGSPTDLLPWYRGIFSGDSGSPYFLLINNQLSLLGTWHFAAGGDGVGIFMQEINAAIAALGSTSSLSQTDLSGFIKY